MPKELEIRSHQKHFAARQVHRWHWTELPEAVVGAGPCTGRASSSNGGYPHAGGWYMWIRQCSSSLWNVSNNAGPDGSDANQ